MRALGAARRLGCSLLKQQVSYLSVMGQDERREES